jgi:3-oxoacyl-[acyl-carrier protein] reductase
MAYDDIITNANESKLESMFRLNTIIPILLTKYVIRNMIFNKIKGSIIHISSISAHTGYKGLSMYAASKASLEAFSKTTAREWGVKGIRSNCIVAGFMETDMSSQLNHEQKQKIYNRTSLKSDTSLESVSNTCFYLISNESISITGTNIFVDSGTI